jgi:ubiquinol-cytochrome c reductase cytochrome b subunit
VSPRLRTFLEAVEDRTGLHAALRAVLLTPLRGEPGWWRAPGTALLLLLGLQLATGVGLATFYSASTTTAWESVDHIESGVLLGWLLRGLHAAGASAAVILLAVHVVAAGWRRVYRAPGEAAWLATLLLVPLLAGFSLTGYLLPWDQRGYWATQVAVGIARATPLVGSTAATAMQGGPAVGTATLTRFFTAHTVVLPFTLLALLALRAALLRRAAAREPGGQPWFPVQAARDLGLFVAVATLMVVWAAREGPGLFAPADPASDFPPRPEWYFAPLRRLLFTVPEPWGSVVVPGLVGAALAALPWLDPAGRPRTALARAVLVVPLAAALALGGGALLADASDEELLAAHEASRADARLARELSRDGVLPGGAGELLRTHPPRRGAKLFEVHCIGCHALDGRGGGDAPILTGYLSERWLREVIRMPRHPDFFGKTKLDGMEPLAKELWGDLSALAAFLRAQDPARRPLLDPALVAKGEAAYTAQECFACHPIDDPQDVGQAPNLAGYGGAPWLRAFLEAPDHDRFYAEQNEMPAYRDELAPVELDALVAFLRTLSGDALVEVAPITSR